MLVHIVANIGPKGHKQRKEVIIWEIMETCLWKAVKLIQAV